MTIGVASAAVAVAERTRIAVSGCAMGGSEDLPKRVSATSLNS